MKVGVFLKNMLLALSVGACCVPSYAQIIGLASLFSENENKPKFLPVEKAFRVRATQQGESLTVNFDITPKHYAYKDKLKITLPQGISSSDWQFSGQSSVVEDLEFGTVTVFEQDFSAKTHLTFNNPTDKTVKITWQGCAKAGLCYPPQTITLDLDIATTQANPAKPAKSDSKAADVIESKSKQSADKNTPSAAHLSSKTPPTNQEPAQTPATKPESAMTIGQTVAGQIEAITPDVHAEQAEPVAVVDESTAPIPTAGAQYTLNHTAPTTTAVAFGLDKSPLLAIGLLFLVGLGLAFTACVYPMLPIVANIVAHSHRPNHQSSAGRALALTMAYGLGIAVVYGVLGALAAAFGQSLGLLGYLQNRWVLLAFALFFVLLGLSMLGVVRLGLPNVIKDKLANQSQKSDRYLGSVGGSFIAGALSALVVSPCVSAPLAGALLGVSALGNVSLGFFALFALGAGLSLPLVVFGVAQGRLMPKTGAWVNSVKNFGAIMLFGVAILLANRVFLNSFMLVIWALWFGVLAVFFWQNHIKPMVLIATIWSACLVVGAAMGNGDPWQPLVKPVVHRDTVVHNLSELDAILSNNEKIVVDVTADWCIECKLMDKELFANRPPEFEDWRLVRVDISEVSEESQAVLARYQLFGPPALLFYKQGQLQSIKLGQTGRTEFVAALK